MTNHWLDHLALVSIGLVVAALAAIPARHLLRRDPSSCYRLSLALLLGALALLPVQWIVQGVAHELARPLREKFAPWIERAGPTHADDDTILVERAPPRGAPTETEPRSELAEATSPLVAAPTEARAGEATSLAGLRERIRAAARSAAGRLRGGAGLLLWLLGAALLFGRRLIGLARTRRLVRRAKPVDDPELLELWRRVAAGSRVGARTRLLASNEIPSPACVGWLRPALLLPAGEEPPLAPDVLAWALRHELVHLERGDWLVAALQSLVTALLWFHPAAWWLSAEIGRLRELSCDQVVVEGFGRRKSYALALLEYAAARHAKSGTNHPCPAIDAGPHSAGVHCALLHWSRSPSQIQRRIEMLTVESGPGSGTRRTLGRLLALSAFVVPALGQVGVAATLFPKDGVKASQAAPAPAPVPSARAESYDDAKQQADVARKKAAIEAAPTKKLAARAQSQATAAIEAQLAEERATAQKVRADGRERTTALKAKLKAARAAGDEEACDELLAALKKCEAECDAACEACDERCDELGEALESCNDDFSDLEFELDDLAVEMGDLDFDAEDVDFDGAAFDDADVAAELGDLALLQYTGSSDDDDDPDARKVKIKRTMADAEKQAAEAHARAGKQQQDGEKDLVVQRRQLDRQKAAMARQEVQVKHLKEAMARDMEKRRRGLKEEHASEEHLRDFALDDADHAKLKEEIGVARKYAQEQAEEARRDATRARRAVPPRAPAPDEPGAPEPRARSRAPRPPMAPTAPDAPTPVMPRHAAPHPGGSEEMLQQRIEALERELQELRAALAESRAREARGARQPRARSMQ